MSEWDEQTVQQEIIKTTGAALLPESRFELFREKLAAYLTDLINHQVSSLISLLYRLDVSEKKIKQVLAAAPDADAGLVIADLVIERQLQKIKTREAFNIQRLYWFCRCAYFAGCIFTEPFRKAVQRRAYLYSPEHHWRRISLPGFLPDTLPAICCIRGKLDPGFTFRLNPLLAKSICVNG